MFYEAVGDHKCREEMRRELNIPEEVCLHRGKGVCEGMQLGRSIVVTSWYNCHCRYGVCEYIINIFFYVTGTYAHEQVYLFALSLAFLLLLQGLPLGSLPTLHIP